jgi:adhesin transport system membrane fusion protein
MTRENATPGVFGLLERWSKRGRAKKLAQAAKSGSASTQQDPAFMAKVQALRADNERLATLDQLSDVYLLRLQPPAPILRHGLKAVALVLLVLVVWASVATLDEVTTGLGKVVTSSREQLVQASEAGVVAELLVTEGQLVEADQPLVRIDDVRLGANMQESQARINGLQAAAIRLRSESQGAALVFPPSLVKRNPELVLSEQNTYRARRQSLDASVAALQQSIKVSQEELTLTEPLAAKGLVSEMDVLRIQRTLTETRGRISELQTKYRAEAAAELARVEGELGSQSATLVGRTDAFKRTVLRAPKRGVVKNIRVTTLGGVVQAGQEIMEIVPIDDTLLIETRIRPVDIAFLRPGLAATVKITAYDSGIYGWLEGELVQISPDTLRDEVRRDETYYRVMVRTRAAELKTKDGKALPIISGMQAYVDIKTGQKSVLSYLFKPLLRAREALRER